MCTPLGLERTPRRLDDQLVDARRFPVKALEYAELVAFGAQGKTVTMWTLTRASSCEAVVLLDLILKTLAFRVPHDVACLLVVVAPPSPPLSANVNVSPALSDAVAWTMAQDRSRCSAAR